MNAKLHQNWFSTFFCSMDLPLHFYYSNFAALRCSLTLSSALQSIKHSIIKYTISWNLIEPGAAAGRRRLLKLIWLGSFGKIDQQRRTKVER